MIIKNLYFLCNDKVKIKNPQNRKTLTGTFRKCTVSESLFVPYLYFVLVPRSIVDGAAHLPIHIVETHVPKFMFTYCATLTYYPTVTFKYELCLTINQQNTKYFFRQNPVLVTCDDQ